jgi:glycosyltransferase involved in cell wall biosynthesis
MRKTSPVVRNEDNFMDLGLSNWRDIMLVRPRNVEDISEALVRLLSDQKLGEDISKIARSFVRTHFALDAACGKHEALYIEMLE